MWITTVSLILLPVAMYSKLQQVKGYLSALTTGWNGWTWVKVLKKDWAAPHTLSWWGSPPNSPRLPLHKASSPRRIYSGGQSFQCDRVHGLSCVLEQAAIRRLRSCLHQLTSCRVIKPSQATIMRLLLGVSNSKWNYVNALYLILGRPSEP